MSEEISREKVSPSGWTERFTIGVPTLSKHKFTIRGEHNIEDGGFHTRVIVTENGIEKEYETFCISDTFDVAMAKVALYCKKNYHLVDRRATLSSEFSEEKGAYVLSTQGGEEVAIVYNSYSTEAMVRAYNFILSYIREYSSGLSYAKRHYLTLPGVVRDSYSDLCFASVEALRFDGVYLFATELRYNIPLRMSFSRMGDAIEFAQELRNLFEYKAKEQASRYIEYQAYGETLSSMDYLSVCFE